MPGKKQVIHELTEFRQCTFGEAGFNYYDNAYRAACSCGWKSAASKDQKALVMLFEVHTRRV